MIASQLLLNKADLIRLRITDVYSLHRVVYNCFPVQTNEQGSANPASFLFCDNGIKKNEREIIILSQTPPHPPVHGVLQSKQIPERLLEFATYRFSITINSVKRESSSGKLIPLTCPEKVRHWFANKSPGWGFSLPPEMLEVRENGVWAFHKKTNQVTLAYAKLAGILQVTDRELFSKSFKQGIGRAKTFGCGLLQITPVA